LMSLSLCPRIGFYRGACLVGPTCHLACSLVGGAFPAAAIGFICVDCRQPSWGLGPIARAPAQSMGLSPAVSARPRSGPVQLFSPPQASAPARLGWAWGIVEPGRFGKRTCKMSSQVRAWRPELRRALTSLGGPRVILGPRTRQLRQTVRKGLPPHRGRTSSRYRGDRADVGARSVVRVPPPPPVWWR